MGLDNPVIAGMQAADQGNPFSGVTQAALGGAQWAQGQASLDLKKQQLQQDQQQHDLMKQQFQAKVGEQKVESLKDLMDTPPDSPLFQTKLKGIKEQWSNENLGPYADPEQKWDELGSLAKDKQEKIDFAKWMTLQTGKKISDPDTYNQQFAKLANLQGIKASVGMFKDMADKEMQAQALANAAMTRAQPFKDRIDAGQVDKALSMAQTGTANDRGVFGTIKRMHDIVDDIKSGKLVGTVQLLNSLNTEKTKIEMGNNRLAEGALERQRSESFLGGINNLIQKVQNAPKGGDILKFADQLTNESDTLGTQYMKDVDTQHEMLREGFADYPKAKNSLDRMFGSLRQSTSSPSVLGSWNGLDKYRITSQKASPPDSTGTQTQPKPSQDDQIKSGMILRQGYDSAKPADRARILLRAKSSLSPDVYAKVFKGVQ